MSLYSFSQAKDLINGPYSCLELVTATKHIALMPIYLGNVKTGILEILNAEQKLFSESLEGVLIAYSNVKMLSPNGVIVDDQPHIHYDVQADFVVFRPRVSSRLRGVVNKIGHDHIGCLVHGCFNASMPRPRHLEGTEWAGSWLDCGDDFVFEVSKLFHNNLVLSMEGRIVNQRKASIKVETSTPKSTKKKKNKRKSARDSRDNDVSAEHEMDERCSLREFVMSDSRQVSQAPDVTVGHQELSVQTTPIGFKIPSCRGARSDPLKDRTRGAHDDDITSDTTEDSGICSVRSPWKTHSRKKSRKYRKRKARDGDGDAAFSPGENSRVHKRHKRSSYSALDSSS